MKSKPEQDIQKLLKTLEEIKEELHDGILDIGDEAAKLIRKRTRLGYGVSEHGARKKKLNSLDDKYTKRRSKLRLSSETTPRRSNLTQSGDMLDDLQAKKTGKGNVEIGFKTELSEDKATWNTDKGRPFNNLSKSEQNQIKDYIQEKINKLIKKKS